MNNLIAWLDNLSFQEWIVFLAVFLFRRVSYGVPGSLGAWRRYCAPWTALKVFSRASTVSSTTASWMAENRLNNEHRADTSHRCDSEAGNRCVRTALRKKNTRSCVKNCDPTGRQVAHISTSMAVADAITMRGI